MLRKFCFVLFSLQLSVCLWWHDYRRDDFPTLKFGVVIADLARHLLRAPQEADGCSGQSHHWLRMCDQWCEYKLPLHVHAAIQKLGIRNLKPTEVPVLDESVPVLFNSLLLGRVERDRTISISSATCADNHQWAVRRSSKLQSQARRVECGMSKVLA